MQLRPPRPTGVTVLAILTFLAANFSFVGAVLFLPYSIILSALSVGFGLLNFVFAMGYLSGNGWAWTLGIVFAIIGIAGGFAEIALGITFPVIGMIPSIVTLLYLTRPHVKVFFGKGFVPRSSTSQATTGSSMTVGSAPKLSSTARQCRNCGSAVPSGATFCHNCGTIQ